MRNAIYAGIAIVLLSCVVGGAARRCAGAAEPLSHFRSLGEAAERPAHGSGRQSGGRSRRAAHLGGRPLRTAGGGIALRRRVPRFEDRSDRPVRSDGKVVKSFGGGMFIWPHGMDVDKEGNVWVTDAVAAEQNSQRRQARPHRREVQS